MSMNAGTTAGAMNTGGLPRGELLGRYRSYEDAQKLVDHLTAAEDFDVKALTIVGNDLRSVEHIRTRLTYPRVALGGAAQGAMFGAFIGLLIYLFSPEASIYNLALSVVLGMAIWMIIGVIGFAMRKGKREYASSSQLVATTFDVVCEFSAAQRARQLVPGAAVMSLNASNDPTSQPSARLTSSPPASAPAQPGSAQPAPAQQAAGHEAQHQQASSRPGFDRQGAGEQGADQQGAGEQRVGEPESDQATAPAPAPQAPVAGYNDLPDGRPRYGVRMPAAEAPAVHRPEPDQPGERPRPDQPTQPGQPTRPDQPTQPEQSGPEDSPRS
ncbi:general stress protein [Nesterenkonia sp. AN1]|uniref:general stress protein n=1 Tax=Nesterenkonia sp. AN1 TaxID=652017 RepID=UPI0004B5A1D6|nr:general stress protein [Nesterenkonia sp. AN1]